MSDSAEQATKISDFQPLTSLSATFSQTLKQGYQAVCKFNVTGSYIYNFALTLGSSSNDIGGYAYQVEDQVQMVAVRSVVNNSVKVTAAFLNALVAFTQKP